MKLFVIVPRSQLPCTLIRQFYYFTYQRDFPCHVVLVTWKILQSLVCWFFLNLTARKGIDGKIIYHGFYHFGRDDNSKLDVLAFELNRHLQRKDSLFLSAALYLSKRLKVDPGVKKILGRFRNGKIHILTNAMRALAAILPKGYNYIHRIEVP
jgi:hypothetical protein